LNKYTKKEIFFTYLKFYLSSFRAHFFTYCYVCPTICTIIDLFSYNKAERLSKKFDDFFLPDIENYFDMAVKLEEIKHPEWFTKDTLEKEREEFEDEASNLH